MGRRRKNIHRDDTSMIQVNLEDIPNYAELCLDENEELREETVLVIHTAEMIGMSTLTAETLSAWLLRTKMLKIANQPISFIYGEPAWPTESMLKRHIGIEVNVRDYTQSEFDEMFLDQIKRSAEKIEVYNGLH